MNGNCPIIICLIIKSYYVSRTRVKFEILLSPFQMPLTQTLPPGQGCHRAINYGLDASSWGVREGNKIPDTWVLS